MNWESYYYVGNNQECIDVWKAWDVYCMPFTDKCQEIEDAMNSGDANLMQ